MNRTRIACKRFLLACLTLLALAEMGQAHATPWPPSLSSPLNGTTINGTSITFRWWQSTGATNYYIEVAQDAGFTQMVYNNWVGNSLGITLTGLPDNGQRFYWRVAALDLTGMSGFLPAWSVVNGPSALPAVPQLSSPTTGVRINGTSIAFKWLPAARANNYYLQVATNLSFTNVIYGGWLGNVIGVTLLNLPDNGQTLYWRVAAGNSLGSSTYPPAWSVINGPSALPAVPTLLKPDNGAKVNGTSIAFSWNVAARASNYHLQVSTNTAFTALIYSAWVGNSTGVTLSGLPDNGQIYYWRVAAGNSLGSSTYTPYRNVINGPSAAPAMPALTSPANAANILGTSIVFKWSVAARANDYQLQVATNSAFTALTYNAWVGNSVGVTLSGMPDNGQQYYWRVRARNALGTTLFTGPWSVTNGPSASPAIPTPLTPVSGSKVSGTSIAFSWKAAARASNYYLEVAEDTAFSQVIYGAWVGNSIGVTLSGLPDNGQIFYWRVKASNSLGSSISTIWNVINGPSAAPPIPAQLLPVNGSKVSGTSISFTWNPAARADNYHIQLATDSLFTQIVSDYWMGNAVGVTYNGLPDNGQIFYWRIQASNGLGTSAYSDTWSVINGPSALPAAPPVLALPADTANAGGTSIAFSWNPVVRANDYSLQVAYDPGFTRIAFDDWLGNVIGVTLSGFADNGQPLYWRVAARNILGTTGYSTRSLINGPSAVPAIPALISPADGDYIRGSTVSFNWTTAARASDYYLQVASDTAFTQLVFGAWVGNTTAVTLSGFPADNQPFYWRVAAGNSKGSSAYPPARVFTSGFDTVPDAPTLAWPLNGAVVGSTSIQFSWAPAPRATGYTIQIARDAAFTSMEYQGAVSSNWTTLSLPPTGGTFYWRVAGDNFLGQGPYSAPNTVISVECTPAPIGTGSGSLGAQNHIDTCYLGDSVGNYILRDINRRANNNPDGHNGQMLSTASIDTSQYQDLGILVDTDNVWNAGGVQASAVDAHVYTGWMYDLLLTQFGLNSALGGGKSMLAEVDNTEIMSNGQPCYNNAFWNNTKGNINVCPGVGQFPFSATLDVMGHEWGHAVTRRIGANLFYSKESGALNEAFSDWIGTYFEYIKRPGNWNWLIGEDAASLRSLADPLQYGHPDTYGGVFWHDTINDPYDNYGVHTNSGVPNKMFYLLSVGGVGRVHAVPVQAIGINAAIGIAYTANTTVKPGTTEKLWPVTATFAQAREGMIQAATMMGKSNFIKDQVRNAWAAVGVGSLHTITTRVASGCGTVSAGGDYPFGQALTVTATPATGCAFVNWTENGTVVSTAASYAFTVNSSRTVTANFKVVP